MIIEVTFHAAYFLIFTAVTSIRYSRKNEITCKGIRFLDNLNSSPKSV